MEIQIYFFGLLFFAVLGIVFLLLMIVYTILSIIFIISDRGEKLRKRMIGEEGHYKPFYFKLSKSFIKYSIVGIIKSVLVLFSLWFFIDFIEVKYRLLTRIIILSLIFILTHYLYKLVGYAQ